MVKYEPKCLSDMALKSVLYLWHVGSSASGQACWLCECRNSGVFVQWWRSNISLPRTQPPSASGAPLHRNGGRYQSTCSSDTGMLYTGTESLTYWHYNVHMEVTPGKKPGGRNGNRKTLVAKSLFCFVIYGSLIARLSQIVCAEGQIPLTFS